MRQDVVVLVVETQEEADVISTELGERYAECSSISKYPEGGWGVAVICDPELEFFVVDKKLEWLNKEYPEARVLKYHELQYEDEYIECPLCGERNNVESECCSLCRALMRGDAEREEIGS